MCNAEGLYKFSTFERVRQPERLATQMTLRGEPITSAAQDKEKQPWDGICCEACWTAEYERCTCKCGGKYHGAGSGKRRTGNKDQEDLQKFQSHPTAQIYERLIKDWSCVCGHDLHDAPILHYDHGAGYPIEGFKENQWLFKTCPVCGHQNSLLHMGVPTHATYADAQKAEPVKPYSASEQDAFEEDEE